MTTFESSFPPLKEMRTILCFGDSNTWGYTPGTGARFAPSTRWPGVLQQTLDEGFMVIEEGLNGRTTVGEAPYEWSGSGVSYLQDRLGALKPLDLVIIMLGTNDLGVFYTQPMAQIAGRIGDLAAQVINSEAGPEGNPPQALILAPPPIKELFGAEPVTPMELKSMLFGQHYAQEALELGCGFLDTAGLIESSSVDGFHLDAGEHIKLGLAVAEWIKQEFSRGG